MVRMNVGHFQDIFLRRIKKDATRFLDKKSDMDDMIELAEALASVRSVAIPEVDAATHDHVFKTLVNMLVFINFDRFALNGQHQREFFLRYCHARMDKLRTKPDHFNALPMDSVEYRMYCLALPESDRRHELLKESPNWRDILIENMTARMQLPKEHDLHLGPDTPLTDDEFDYIHLVGDAELLEYAL